MADALPAPASAIMANTHPIATGSFMADAQPVAGAEPVPAIDQIPGSSYSTAS